MSAIRQWRTLRFSIRSFGSYGEAAERLRSAGLYDSFSIRSFGSYGEAEFTKPAGVQKKSFSIRSFGSYGEALSAQ